MSNIRRYELYIVLRPDLDDEQRETFIESLNAFVNDQAGQIISTQRLGKRRLAYPIQHLLEGYDVLYELLLPAAGAVEAVARQAEEKAQADAAAAEEPATTADETPTEEGEFSAAESETSEE